MNQLVDLVNGTQATLGQIVAIDRKIDHYDVRWDDSLPDHVSCVPSDENPMPPRGQNVVYVLYDASSTPCYVGSTGDFSTRLKWHLKDRKPVVVWIAYPCDSRKAAYALEDRLLKQHKPYLNKRAGA